MMQNAENAMQTEVRLKKEQEAANKNASQAKNNKHIFKKINLEINEIENAITAKNLDSKELKNTFPFLGELMIGHLRYGTFGKNNIQNVHPFLRQNNWMHRNIIVAGNFNLTNVNELFDNLVDLGQHPKEKADTITIM